MFNELHGATAWRDSSSPLAGLGHSLHVIAVTDFGNWVADFSYWFLGSAVLWLIGRRIS
ncbi:hypothetical protein GIB67_014172 [Kingdonia uniflora]|uniref:Uncharacterized protein n=1 Tax=Kingdonia uniflora TaxID=39325 RepID=A0A7J7NP53_9MAGN|nr:hypothetical protein GIB67_014172 [Kingdonia uniflora]